jgi:DNA-binding transcriptional LysR family regulator
MKPRLDSRALGFFVAVADSLSFRQAAQALHLSQPPLSRAIRELEERLQARLFERDTRSVTLTEAGQRLLPRARQILQLLADAEADMTARQDLLVLKLGVTNALEPAWLQGLQERLVAARPGLSVQVVSASSPQLVRQSRAQRLHAALIALPTETAGLEVVEIERHPMCAALPSSHRLARRREVALADLAAETLFWFERARQPAFFDHCQQVFARHGFAPPTRREPADQHVLLAEVAAQRGVALLPATFRELRRRGVVYRPLAEGAELWVGLGLALPPGREDLRRLVMSAVNAKR